MVNESSRHYQNIGVIVLTGEVRYFCIPAECGTNSLMFVQRHIDSVSTAADCNTGITFARFYCDSQRMSIIRIIYTCGRISSEIFVSPAFYFQPAANIFFQFKTGKLAYIRDIFIFASFTVLSFVDIQELTNDNIVEVNGEKWILSKRHKTKVAFQVKLLDIPLQIVERYRPMQKDNRIFPDLNYWSICKPLKRMIRECGITKSISFHCSRHGFATLALSKGMPIESVSRVLGHTNIVTTQLYAKITTQKLDNDLTMFGDKLSKTFNGITMS